MPITNIAGHMSDSDKCHFNPVFFMYASIPNSNSITQVLDLLGRLSVSLILSIIFNISLGQEIPTAVILLLSNPIIPLPLIFVLNCLKKLKDIM